jgi:tetratricopeptide (TPR) repeat protein
VLYGSVPEAEVSWPYSVFLALGIATLLISSPLLQRRDRHAASSARLLLLLGLLALLALLQLVPLPRALFGILAPGHARDLAVLLPERSFSEATTDPGLTGQAAMRLVLLLGAGLAVLRFAGGPRRGWIVLGALAGAAALGSAYGILEANVLGDRVLGLEKVREGGGVTGTFFYRGSFAAFTAAGLGISAAGLVAAFRGRRPALAAGAAMAVAILVTGLLLSRSRAGLAAGGLALGVGLALRMRSARARWSVAGLALVAVLGAGLLTGSVRERFTYLGGGGSHGFLDIRVPAWSSTLDLAAGRPVLGAGIGAYRRAIHLTQSPDNPGELYFAHSDPLNLLAEGGAIGLFLGAALAVLGLAGALRLARERDSPACGVGTACAAGLAGLLLMAAVDFPLQIPALALALVVLLFLPAANAGPGRLIGRRLLAVLVLGSLALLVAAFPVEYHPARGRALTLGQAAADRGHSLLDLGLLDRALVHLGEARERQPFEGATRCALARALFRKGRFTEARAELLAARRLAHGRAKLLFRVGEMAYRAGWPFAVDALREACALEPKYFPVVLTDLVDESLVPAVVPERGYAWRITGKWLRDRGRSEEALAAWWKAFELGEGVEPMLAGLYHALGREEEGRRAFSERGAVWPD